MTNRRILRICGPDAAEFLQGLVTSDVSKLSDGPIYTAILTPQGKYLADFFVLRAGETILIDVADTLSEMLTQRLMMYRLRAKVEITPTPLHAHRGIGEKPTDGYQDPRHPGLGWRAYRETPQTDDDHDWDALRVMHVVPETGIELTADTFILEAGFERLNGVDFKKGCYVGQEVTARMKHKAELRKGLAKVTIDGAAPVGTPLLAQGKAAGTLFTQSNGAALAHLRFDRAKGQMKAEDATVTWHA
ncbi:MAG: folate-binding protein [Pseudomonadota bacterium]